LVIAVGTEFSVLVVARYLEERRGGSDSAAALSGGVVRIGRAFVASGLTLVGGFAVLVLSPMPLLRDFGIVVALAVAFALLTALTFLPPLLAWTDHRGWLRVTHASAAPSPEAVRCGDRAGARPRVDQRL
jgi:predicted RND superfamily exporter protein